VSGTARGGSAGVSSWACGARMIPISSAYTPSMPLLKSRQAPATGLAARQTFSSRLLLGISTLLT